jgi:hypothetical protein
MQKIKKLSSLNLIRLLILITILQDSVAAFSQTSPDTVSVSQNVSDTVKWTNPHSLYAGAGFASNMIYMGTSISQDKPIYGISLTYGLKDRLYVSASTYHLSAFSPFLAFHTISVNYSNPVNSWFDISTGIARYQVAQSLTDTLFSSFVYGYLSLGFDWKILYTNISGSAIFSENTSGYLQVRNSRYFQTPEFQNGKGYISFDPYINILLGNLTRTETSEGTVVGISQPFSSRKSGRNSSHTGITFFGFMEIDAGIPVALNIGKFTFEAEPGYILPFYSDTEIFNPKGFVFLFNCYFKIL